VRWFAEDRLTLQGELVMLRSDTAADADTGTHAGILFAPPISD